VFWLKDAQGQPARFFVAAEGALSIAQDLAGFGSDINDLKKRLRARRGIELFDSFPPYGAWFRRRFGIDNEQALELFHQTVSMKSVGNLTDFVREHMLESFRRGNPHRRTDPSLSTISTAPMQPCSKGQGSGWPACNPWWRIVAATVN